MFKKLKGGLKKMITKEDFLKNTTEDEVFSLIEEFLFRAKEKKELTFILTDREKITIVREILENLNN